MKIQLVCFWALLTICTTPIFSQRLKGQIIDAKTSEPIAFATIQFDRDQGVVSNTEGYFNLSSEELNAESALTISFMGYQTQILTVKKLQEQNNIVLLNEAVNQLNTVYITNKLPSVDSILARVNRNLSKNYQLANAKQTLFSRETVYFKANNLVVDIEKSSNFNKNQLESSNRQFKELTDQIVNNPPTQTFTDALLDVYQLSNGKTKMEVKKATKLKDRKNSLSLETIQKRVTNIVLQHLDTTKTYKVKTGWFTVEDSMSLKKSKDDKKDMDDSSFDGLKSETMNGINEHLFNNESMLDFVKDTSLYDYELTNVTTIDDQLVYIINFKPRRNRANFKGTMHIANDDYAILKMNYSFGDGKVGDKLNLKLLLGVKYVENINNGTVIYKKNIETNSYYPYYINHESGQYVYAHRPFKFIENNGNQKNKVAFDAIIEGTIVQKQELMCLDFKAVDETTSNGITEAKTVEFIQLKQYDPSIWSEFTILEPLEELKKFKVQD